MKDAITIGELFAGIGGFGLGLERAIPSARIVWQVESNPFCQKVLEKHWPNAKRYTDVRFFPDQDPKGFEVDIIAAGFPCQGISSAGKRQGLQDYRTGLWWEVERICRVLRPPILLLENVPNLTAIHGGEDFGIILGSLHSLGYDAEWGIISAESIGAPHKRERLFIVGIATNAHQKMQSIVSRLQKMARWKAITSVGIPNSNGIADQTNGKHSSDISQNGRARNNGAVHGNDLIKWQESIFRPRDRPCQRECSSGYPFGKEIMPEILGMADGISNRLDRYQALGNAIVPQCSEYLGKRLIQAFLKYQS